MRQIRQDRLSGSLWLAFTALVLLTLTPQHSPAADSPLPVPDRGFISSEPAETWEQGLICGNGTMGVNVLSEPLDETIIFSHERLFLPEGPPVMPPLVGPRLFEVRRLIDRGLYKQATQLTFDLSDQEGFMYPDRFVPAFDLSIQMDAAGKVRDYMRSVDFQTGVATVHWADDRGVFERRVFVSRKDGIAVLLLTASKAGTLDCRLRLKPREPSDKLDPRQLASSAKTFEEYIADIQSLADESTMTYRNSFTKAYPGSIHALEGVAHVVTEGGGTKAESDTLLVTDADQVLVLVDLKMIFDPEQSQLEEAKKVLAALPADFATLLKPHIRLHGELFNRMRLDIGGGADHQLTSEELLAKSTNEELNRALIEKEFDAGRYNIISCTGELPPTLQGVWGGTYSPGWASDYTHNGNVPSAIASIHMGNMPELMLAYTSYIESIVPYLELNAHRIFGARGVVLPSRSSTNGFNNSFAPQFAGAFWVGGAAWAAHFFYDYYLYTGDEQFLAEHALPFMEKAALFFEDYLYEGPDGKYVFSPTQSPENTPGNTNSQGSFNATMDVAAARELLQNLIAASMKLGKNRDKVRMWNSMLHKMPDYMVGEDGVVKEWLTPKLTDRLSHRHSSQLYPLYDGMPPEIADEPQLRDAFKRIIEIKLERHWKKGSGFMSFGLVQLGQAATSLEDGELAYQCLIHLVNRYWLNNLASMHNHKSLFNMDISGGMPAVVIKMLVASEPGRIHLLPACPSVWPSGAIEGVLCRGQIEVKSLRWTPESVTVSLLSSKEQTVSLRLPAEIRSIQLVAGRSAVKRTDHRNSCAVDLSAEHAVTLKILLR